MKVENESTVYKPFEEQVKQVEVEPQDEVLALVENEMNVKKVNLHWCQNLLFSLNYESNEDDKAGQIKECGQILRE